MEVVGSQADERAKYNSDVGMAGSAGSALAAGSGETGSSARGLDEDVRVSEP